MGFLIAQTYLSDILHVVSQALLIPVIILLLLFIAYALYCIGSIVSEYFNERRHFKVVMPKFLSALMAAEQEEVPRVIEESGLLRRQKNALLTAYDYRMLPGDALIALIRRLVSEEESHYDRIRARNNMAARISPMIGLMGTLIPLGPGIEALGRADTTVLSSSLLIAFDTTVAGLVVAAICLAVGKIRGNWYDSYLSALDAAMATMLEKVEDLRNAGEIVTEEPRDYAFMFESVADTTSFAKAAAVEEEIAAEEEAAVKEAAERDAAAIEAAAAEAAAKEVAAREAAAAEAAEREAAAAEAAAREAAAREAAAAEAAEREAAAEAAAAEIAAKEAAEREAAAAEAAAREAAERETAAREAAAAEAAEREAAAAEAAAREAAAREAAAAEAAEREAAAAEIAAREAAAREAAAAEAAAAEIAAAQADAEAAAREAAAQEAPYEFDFCFEPPRRPWE